MLVIQGVDVQKNYTCTIDLSSTSSEMFRMKLQPPGFAVKGLPNARLKLLPLQAAQAHALGFLQG